MNRTLLRLTALLVAASALVVLQPLGAQETTHISRTIHVSGEYKTTVTADMAVLTLSVNKQAVSPLAAQEAVTGAADKIITAMLSAGIERKNIATSAFTLYAIYNDEEGKRNEILGYNSTSTVTVTIYDTDQVGALIQSGMEAGANEIQSLSYQKRDAQAMEIELYQKAVLNAMEKATALAQTLGMKLGKAIIVEEQSFSAQSQDERVFFTKAMAAPSSAEEAFAPGSIQMSAVVRIVFELE